jgi:hypothetical protein
MKLRNKKTGEIAEIKLKLNESLPDAIRRTIEEAGWEETREPLIKDEKIRKAVRAWAEANDIKEIIIFDSSNNAPYTPVGAVEFAGNASRLKVLFRTGERFDTNMIYTIEELCGEEEE